MSQATILQREIDKFNEYHSVCRIKSNLNRMLIAYLQAYNDYPKYHNELVEDYEAVIDLVDCIDGKSLSKTP